MRSQRGFSLLELMVTMGLVTVLLGIAAMSFRELSSAERNGAEQLAGFLKQARAKAVNSTLAYTVFPDPSDSGHVIATRGTACSAPQTVDSALELELPTGAELAATGWSICYTPRGLSQNSADIVVRHGSDTKTVRVVLGGGAKVL